MTDNSDPFVQPPGLPADWLVLRRLLQGVIAIGLLSGPTIITFAIERTIANVQLSATATIMIPILGIAMGILIRRSFSKSLGTLAIIGFSGTLGLMTLLFAAALILG